MQKVNIVWDDSEYGHLHVYVSYDGYGVVVVVFIEPKNLGIVKTYPYDEFVESLPEILRRPFEEAYRRLVSEHTPPPWKRASAITR